MANNKENNKEEINAAAAAEEIKKESSAQIEYVKSFFTDKLNKMDAQLKDLSNNVKNKYVPEAENKIKENLLTSLLVSFASGLVLGLVLMVAACFGGKKR